MSTVDSTHADSGGGRIITAERHLTTTVGTFTSNVTRVERSRFETEPDDSQMFDGVNDESEIITLDVSNLAKSSSSNWPSLQQNYSSTFSTTFGLPTDETDLFLQSKQTEFINNNPFSIKADNFSTHHSQSHVSPSPILNDTQFLQPNESFYESDQPMFDEGAPVLTTPYYSFLPTFEYPDFTMSDVRFATPPQQFFENNSANLNDLTTAIQALHDVQTGNFSDDTSRSNEEWETGSAWVITFLTVSVASLYALIFIVGICGNSLVIATVLSVKRLRTTTYKLAANLAIADLLVLTFCLPANLLTEINKNWLLGGLFCRFGGFFQAVSVFASVWSLVAIAFEKNISICHPLKRYWVDDHLVIIVPAIWTFAIMIASPLVGAFEIIDVGARVEQRVMKLTVCIETWSAYQSYVAADVVRKYYFTIVCVWLSFIIPLVCILICYGMNVRQLWRRRIPGAQIQHQNLTAQGAAVAATRLMQTTIPSAQPFTSSFSYSTNNINGTLPNGKLNDGLRQHVGGRTICRQQTTTSGYGGSINSVDSPVLNSKTARRPVLPLHHLSLVPALSAQNRRADVYNNGNNGRALFRNHSSSFSPQPNVDHQQQHPLLLDTVFEPHFGSDSTDQNHTQRRNLSQRSFERSDEDDDDDDSAYSNINHQQVGNVAVIRVNSGGNGGAIANALQAGFTRIRAVAQPTLSNASIVSETRTLAEPSAVTGNGRQFHLQQRLLRPTPSSTTRSNVNPDAVARQNTSRNMARRSTMRALSVFGVVILLFFVCELCWVVMFSYILFFAADYGGEWMTIVLGYGVTAARLLVTANSCINPFIYAYFMPSFRRGFMQVLARYCCWWKKSGDAGIYMASRNASRQSVSLVTPPLTPTPLMGDMPPLCHPQSQSPATTPRRNRLSLKHNNLLPSAANLPKFATSPVATDGGAYCWQTTSQKNGSVRSKHSIQQTSSPSKSPVSPARTLTGFGNVQSIRPVTANGRSGAKGRRAPNYNSQSSLNKNQNSVRRNKTLFVSSKSQEHQAVTQSCISLPPPSTTSSTSVDLKPIQINVVPAPEDKFSEEIQ